MSLDAIMFFGASSLMVSLFLWVWWRVRQEQKRGGAQYLKSGKVAPAWNAFLVVGFIVILPFALILFVSLLAYLFDLYCSIGGITRC